MQPNLVSSRPIDIGDIVRRDKCLWNPLSVDPVASQFSSYAAFQDTVVVRPLVPNVPVDAELIDAHDQLSQQIAGDSYPCTGAISVFAQKGYRFGLFPELACDNAVRAVCHDLYEFCHEFPVIDDQLITFIAMFRGPAIESEQHFEDLLWSQLQAMHAIDSDFFAWDKSVDSDPKNNNFSFSIGGRAMFVIGMHPKASRLARTARYPTLVFNLHEQFERLRARGKFETMKQIIRAREMEAQGSINPMLKNFGDSSEASQYSGRAVSHNWTCPFHAHKKDETMTTQQLTRIAPQSGCSFKIQRGQVLRVVDPLGEQVSDLFAFDEHDHDCRLSSGRSLDYAGRIYLTTNDTLYANNSKPMFTIIQDTVGLHDFLLTPCSQEMFEILYKHKEYHPSCFENLRDSLKEHGISGCQISTTFNIFMNVKVDQQGKVTVGVPMSKSGDYIDLRAEMDMVCGLTACSAEGSNNGRFKPIDFSILG